jgi:Tfp pilus assembly protein PilN
MIKINLLESVTDRTKDAPSALPAVASSPRTYTALLIVAVIVVTVLVSGALYVGAVRKRTDLQADLERETQIAAKMVAIRQEQADLKKKIDDVDTRINAIKKLRESQKGPVALMSEINERLPNADSFTLESLELKGTTLTIKGKSPYEEAVTQFGRSMEFSSGLFKDVSIETNREQSDATVLDQNNNPVPLEIVTFTLKCNYSPAPPESQTKPANATKDSATGNQVAQK